MPESSLARRALRSAVRRRAEWFAVRDFRGIDDLSFSIVSNDCWGGEIYRLANAPYRTPFVGLMLMGPCYLRVLEALDDALASSISPVETSRYPETVGVGYPIGRLDGVDAELHFIHYPTFEEAQEKWVRRAARIDRSRLFFKMSVGKDRFGPAEIERFLALRAENKLAVAAAPVPGLETAVGPWRADAVEMLHAVLPRFDPVKWLNADAGAALPGRSVGRALKYAGW